MNTKNLQSLYLESVDKALGDLGLTLELMLKRNTYAERSFEQKLHSYLLTAKNIIITKNDVLFLNANDMRNDYRFIYRKNGKVYAYDDLPIEKRQPDSREFLNGEVIKLGKLIFKYLPKIIMERGHVYKVASSYFLVDDNDSIFEVPSVSKTGTYNDTMDIYYSVHNFINFAQRLENLRSKVNLNHTNYNPLVFLEYDYENDFIDKHIDDLSFIEVPLEKIPLSTINMSAVKPEHKDYLFVMRDEVYYGAFKLSETEIVRTNRCEISGYLLSHLRKGFNEKMSVYVEGNAYMSYLSNYAVKYLLSRCDYCSNYRYKDDKSTRCKRCTNELNNLDLGDINITRDAFFVKDYEHTDAVNFYNDDFSTTSRPQNNALYLGVELEVDNDFSMEDIDDEDDRDEAYRNRDRHANLVGQVLSPNEHSVLDIKQDGSLDSGFEIVFQPATTNYHLNKIDYARAFKLLKRLGYRSHDYRTCGLHVHINRDFFGSSRDAQLYNGAKMVYLLEKYWEEFVRFSRRTTDTLNRWAARRNAKANFDSADNGEKNADKLTKSFRENYTLGNKYIAFNTNHSATFELRIFRGTLKLETYLATLQLVDNFARMVKDLDINTLQNATFEDIVNYRKYKELSNYWALKKGNPILTDRFDDESKED